MDFESDSARLLLLGILLHITVTLFPTESSKREGVRDVVMLKDCGVMSWAGVGSLYQ